jgi:hypothetical protein
VGKGHGRVNMVQILCILVCKWKILPIETVLGMVVGEGLGRMMEGMNSSLIYLTYCKNICKCHNVPPPSIIKNEKKQKAFQKQKWKEALHQFNGIVSSV